MARTVDDRVVSASFETSKFESGVGKMLSGIDKLKKSMQFQNAGKGLDQLNAHANKVNLSHIARGVDTISSKLGALRLTAIATFASIAQRGIAAGANLVKKFTFAPVMQGLHEYENQLNSVQTILANTRDQGTNLKQVNGALNQLNEYADKTIYNFGQMTKNVGTFTAAGVDLKTSVASIKGISNLAALSGSSAQQASTAMYQLSQAISAGRVGLQDWNSVVNAGMGGAVFQKSLMRTAENMGALKKGAVDIDKATGKATVNGESFRQSIMAKPGEQSWLTGDVLTSTLKQLSGEMTNAQLKAEGFSDAQIKAIQSQAKTALNAATKIKTFSQLMDTTKEAIGSGWAQTWMLVLGDFGEAKHLFTSIGGAVGDFVKKSAHARNSVLKDWKDLGGRTLLIKSLKEVFQDLARAVDPIRRAFRDVFPRKTGKDLFAFTQGLAHLARALQPSIETVVGLRRTFRGFFALLDIGKMVIGGIFTAIGKMFGSLSNGSGSILGLTGSWGDWIYALDQSLKKSGAINKFFSGLGKILAAPIVLIQKFADAMNGAFSGDGMGNAGKSMNIFQQAIAGLEHAWDSFITTLSSSDGVVHAVQDSFSSAFSNIGEAMADGVQNASMDSVFKILELGLLAGIGVLVHKIFSGGMADALSGGVLGNLSKALQGFGGLGKAGVGVLEGFTGQMKAMQREVQSKALLNIAIAVGILAASIIGLSMVDPEKLNSAMTAITIAFGELLGAMAIMDKIGKSAGFVKVPIISASMILLAVAIDTLAIAVYALSRLSWEELAKGLGAVSVLLIGISAASGPLSANAAGMIRAGLGITVIAVAMNILAKAVASFGSMDMPTLAKGIGGIAVALAGIGAASHLFPSGMVALGLGLIAIGAGLKLIADTIQTLGGLDLATLGKGIGAIALALAGIGLAMKLMPGPSMILTATGLLLVSVALGKIAKAVQAFGGMSVKEIAKGLGTLGGALGLLAAGLYLMSGTLGGSAALLIAATGIAILTPALESLGDQSWGQIVKGLVALGAAFALLGVAGVVLAPVAPAILALGAALIAVGAGLALAGAGVFLIGLGLSAVAVAGPAAVKILVDALAQLALIMPKVIQGLVKSLLQLVESVAQAAPKFVKAIGKIISLMALAVVQAAPQLEKAFIAILDLVFGVLRKETPNLIRTGISMLKALLVGIAKNISNVVKMVVTIVAKFLGAIAANLGKLITGGAQILAAILKGIAQGVSKVVSAAVSIITNFLRGIANNISKVAKAGVEVITRWLKAIADGGPRIIRAGTNVIVKLVKGIGDAAGRVVTAALKTATKFIVTVANRIPKEVDRVASGVIKMMNALAPIIRKREGEFIKALASIGVAIGQGIVDGFTGIGGKLMDKLKGEIKGLPGKAGKAIKGIFSANKPITDTMANALINKTNFTSKVKGFLRDINNNVVKEFISFGEENLRTFQDLLGNMGQMINDALLSGFDIPAADPAVTVLQDVVNLVSGTQDQIEQSTRENVLKIKKANSDLAKSYDALHAAKKKHDNSAANSARQNIRQAHQEIESAQGVIDINNKMLGVLKNVNDAKTGILHDKAISDQIGQLVAWRNEVDRLNGVLETQIATLEDYKQKKIDLNNTTVEKFSALPGIISEDAEGNPIDPATQVQTYISSLGGADDTLDKFRASLDALQGMGLNTDTYAQLLDVGPAAQGFVDALISMGPDAVAAINSADTDLKNVATVLGDHASSYMYDSSIKTWEGFVKGTRDSIKTATAEAVKLVDLIIKAVKKKLKIKSPSRVFAEVGSYSVKGLALGFENSSKLVTDAIYGVSDDAKTAIKKSMSGLSDIVTDSINPNPTITPILDLSQIQAKANEIGSILPTSSLMLASGITVPESGDNLSETGQAAPIQFNQYNQSPESLSNIEIYRQTKNQLAQARPVLAK